MESSSSSELSDPPSSPLSFQSKSPSLSPRTSLAFGATTSATATSSTLARAGTSASFMAKRRTTTRPLSPPSTIPSGSASPMKHHSDAAIEAEACVNADGPPPAKRRRIEKKPRTTEHLTLQDSDLSPQDEDLLEMLTTALRKKKKIVVIAGAGISVSAGIPDFRSEHGLFATLRNQHKIKASGKHLFDASVYKHDSTTSSFHAMVRELAHLTRNAEPTSFHQLIASLAAEGRLLRLYTQNVDGLDTGIEPLATDVPLNPKGPFPKTIQLHGGLAKMVCSKCNEISDFNGELFDGPNAPPCKACEETDHVRTSHAGKRSHGIGRMRPRMVLYNEFNPDEEAIANVVRADLRARPDAVIVVGTSMKIPGVRHMVHDMCKVTRKRKDGFTAWINLEPEPSGAELKDCWDLVVKTKCDHVASLVALPRWDQHIDQGAETILDNGQIEDYERRRKSRKSIEVEIPSSQSEADVSVMDESRETTPTEEAKPKLIDRIQGIPTPTASPKIGPRISLPLARPQKQSQLAFAFAAPATISPTDTITSTNTAGPAVKATRKPPKTGVSRKPKQPVKAPAKPRNTVTNSFKATKSLAGSGQKSQDFKSAEDRLSKKRPLPSSMNVRDLINDDFSLRPRAPKQPRDSFEAQITVETQIKQEHKVYAEPPVTPTMSEERPTSSSSARETITPPSKPRGLGLFID